MSYEEEDTCMHAVAAFPCVDPYEEENICHMRRRIHACMLWLLSLA